jgi:AcrR family transcriptional regulator
MLNIHTRKKAKIDRNEATMNARGKIFQHRPLEVSQKTRRWEKQRQKILLAAGRLFSRKGYIGTSIDDIGKAAKVNKAAIYYYFKDKSFLLYEIVITAQETMNSLTLPILSSNASPKEKLFSAMTTQIKWQASHPELAGIGQAEIKNLPLKFRRDYVSMRDEYENIYRTIIKEGITKGEFSVANVKLTGLFLLGLVNSIMLWYKPKGTLSADDIASEAYKFALRAVKAGNNSSTDQNTPS